MSAAGCDVLVIGAGFGAAAVVRALDGAGATIALVDAGPAWGERPGAHLRNAPGLGDDDAAWRALVGALGVPPVRSPGAALAGVAAATPAARVHPEQRADEALPGLALYEAVGGLGLVWSGVVLPPAAPHGFTADELEGARAWLAAAPVAGSPRQELLARRHGLIPLPLARTAAGRWIGPADVGGAAFRVAAGVTALRLACDGARVRGAVVRDGGGERLIEAQHVVVAAGVIGTVRLLAASGFAASHPGLGRGIADHGLAFGQAALTGDDWDAVAGAGDALATPVALRASPLDGHHVVVIAEEPRLLVERVHPHAAISVYAYTTLPRRAGDRLDFDPAHARDGLALPRVVYRPTDDDRRRGAAAVELARAWTERIGTPLPGGKPRLLPGGAAQHLACGASVGDDGDPLAIADRTGRVRGVDNLWVAGAAALDAPVTTHPVQSIVALGARTGCALRGR